MNFNNLFSLKKELDLFEKISILFDNQKEGCFLYTSSSEEYNNLEKEFQSVDDLKFGVLFTEEPYLISVKDKEESFITLSGKNYFICYTKIGEEIKLHHFNENTKNTDKLEISTEKKFRVFS